MDTPPPRRAPRGIALPMAVMAVALLTSLIAGALLVMGSERRVIDTQDASVKAAVLAQSALQWFLNERCSTYGLCTSPPADPESTRINYAGLGYADVVLRQIRPAAGAAKGVYLVRSHAVLTRGTLSGLPQAERTVAQYALWVQQSMKVNGGWTSLSGLSKNGTAGKLSGVDACGQKPSVPGVTVPKSPGYAGPISTPPIYGGVDSAQVVDTLSSKVHIDWNGIVNQNALTPDLTIPPNSWPSFPPGYWPIIMVRATDFVLPSVGRGTLIVTGNITINGSNQWAGVVMVGGALTSNGNNIVEGIIMSGLNTLLGMTVPMSSVGNGTKTYEYNSCNMDTALAHLSSLRTFNNAWADNWSGW